MKKYIIGILIGIIIIAAVIAIVFIMNNNGSEEETGAVLTTLQVNEVARSVFYAPQYVAINNGFFEKEGLKKKRMVKIVKKR